jgi:hypothetical protein
MADSQTAPDDGLLADRDLIIANAIEVTSRVHPFESGAQRGYPLFKSHERFLRL